jgi:hypothetical protein
MERLCPEPVVSRRRILPPAQILRLGLDADAVLPLPREQILQERALGPERVQVQLERVYLVPELPLRPP